MPPCFDYKYCGVPGCKSSSISTPNKLFIHVPRQERKRWCRMARRATMSGNSLFFCEDHFDLPNVMENYIEYQLMGSVKRFVRKPGCVPTKFHCQPDRLSRMASETPERPVNIKRRKFALMKDMLEQGRKKNITPPPPEISLDVPATDASALANEKGVQVDIKVKRRSKGVQAAVQVTNSSDPPVQVEYASCPHCLCKLRVIIDRNYPSKNGDCVRRVRSEIHRLQ